MKNKFITTVVATALALTMTFSLANGMDVKAAEITEDSLVAAEDTNASLFFFNIIGVNSYFTSANFFSIYFLLLYNC